MDEIAERAGVSKPVLYQHFPGKRELYLALIEQHTAELLAGVRRALASTTDNKLRVAATIGAYFEFIDSESEAFRLVFESDLTNDPEVRDMVDNVTIGCAQAIADVIREEAGLPRDEAELLGVALAGMANRRPGTGSRPAGGSPARRPTGWWRSCPGEACADSRGRTRTQPAAEPGAAAAPA